MRELKLLALLQFRMLVVLSKFTSTLTEAAFGGWFEAWSASKLAKTSDKKIFEAENFLGIKK